MTVKLFNKQIGTTINESVLSGSNSIGASIVQCGWNYLYIGNNGQPISGGSLWSIDPVTGVPISKIRTAHTIATGLPTTSYVGSTNDFSEMLTSYHNGKLYMYIHYGKFNPNIVYRGTWNEANLRFEDFQPFVTFDAVAGNNLNGQYGTMVNWGSGNIFLISNSGYYAGFYPDGSVWIQPTTFAGTWSPTSYTFNTGFYSAGYAIGGSGDGTNWYQFGLNPNPAAAFNPTTNSAYIQGFNYTSSPWLLRTSDFFPVIYFLYTNGDIKTMMANTDTIFINPKLSYVTKTYRPNLSTSSKSINFPKYSDGKVNTAKIGNLIIKQDIDNVQQVTDMPSNSRWCTDNLVGKNYIYRLGYNMSTVQIWNKKDNGDFGTYVKTVSWESMDTRINEICRNGSSVPTAFAIVVNGNDDYLVGWSGDKAFIYSWKINSDGSISYSNSYATPNFINSYGRAGWDGGNYVYFYDYMTRIIYKWTIFTSTVTNVCTLDDHMGINSSYTGSGHLVKNGYIYIPQSANERDNSIAMAMWKLSDGSLVSILPYYSLYGLYKTGNIGTGGIQLTPLHNKAYLISTSINAVTMNIDWDLNTVYTTNSHILSYESDYKKELKDFPKEYRTVGNKTLNNVLQVAKIPQASSGLSNILVGKSKIYCQEALTNKMYVFNKNSDGSVGSYIGVRDWGVADGNIKPIITNPPSAGTLYIDSNGIDHFIGFMNTPGGYIYDWIINADGSLGALTTYTVNAAGTTTGVNTNLQVGYYKRAGWDGGNYIYVVGFLGDNYNTGLFRWDLTAKGALEFVSTIFSNNYATSSYTYSGLLVENDYVYLSSGADGSGGYALLAYNRNSSEKQPYPMSYPESMLNSYNITNQLVDLYKNYVNVSSFELEAIIGHISLTPLHPVGYGIYVGNLGKNLIPKIVVINIEKSQALNTPGVDYKKYSFEADKDITNKTSALTIGFQDWSIMNIGTEFKFTNSNSVGDGSSCMLGYGSDPYYNGKAGITSTTASGFRFKAPISGVYKFKVSLRNGDSGRVYNVSTNTVIKYLYGSAMVDVYCSLSKDQQIDFIEDGSGIIGIFEICIPQPLINSFPEIINGTTKVKSLSRLPVSWKPSTDLENDVIIYDIDLYNGSSWILLGSTSETSYNPIIPNLNISNAKLRVKARSGQSGLYSSYIESNIFTILPPDTSLTPNYLSFDGIDDAIDMNDAAFLPKGDFTFEFLFRTISDSSMTLIYFYQGLKVYMNSGVIFISCPGMSTIVTSAKYNDGLLHHIALRRSGTNISLLIDGISITSTKNSIDFTKFYDGFYFGSSGLTTQLFQGVMSLPRFWNDARTDNELITYKDIIVSDTEQGLADYLIFEPNTGKIRAKKNTAIYGKVFGGIQWSFRFVPIDTSLPYPDDFQRKENLEHLRDKVNELRSSNGMPPLIWTDPVLVKGYTPIKAVHWNEVENALHDVYDNTGEVISTPEVKEQLEEVILPNNKNFPVKNLGKRMKNILKGLKND